MLKRGGYSCKKKRKNQKGCLRSPNVVDESHGHWGCRKSEENAHFRVLQIKGELKKLSVPTRYQGAAVGTGGREGREGGREGASDSGL